MFSVAEIHFYPGDVQEVYRKSDAITVGRLNDQRWFVKRHNNTDPSHACVSFDALIRSLTADERRSIGL